MRCTCGLVFLPTLWGAGNNYISTVQTITKAAEEKKIVIQIFLSFVGVGLPTVKCNSIYWHSVKGLPYSVKHLRIPFRLSGNILHIARICNICPSGNFAALKIHLEWLLGLYDLRWYTARPHPLMVKLNFVPLYFVSVNWQLPTTVAVLTIFRRTSCKEVCATTTHFLTAPSIS